jgi:hypothetical protein
MSGRVEPAEVVERYRRWLASVPLAERSKREYARNVEAFCGWLAEVDTEGWGGDPLADPGFRPQVCEIQQLALVAVPDQGLSTVPSLPPSFYETSRGNARRALDTIAWIVIATLSFG